MYYYHVSRYLQYCQYQKNLDEKTIKSYHIDLKQFRKYLDKSCISEDLHLVTREVVAGYIAELHNQFKPRSVKRKIASLKAFFYYLEYNEVLLENPFVKMRVRYKEPEELPRTISIINLQKLLSMAYQLKKNSCNSEYQKRKIIRDIAVMELLFSTGVRVSELCGLKKYDLDMEQGIIRIYGKGAKERMIYLANHAVVDALKEYKTLFNSWIDAGEWFFYNRDGKRLSEQSVRLMLRQYTAMAGVKERITPHMFRHTFATLLLEEDVDIRYIQQILGHSSITTTQIYTHVAMQKQKLILTERHPRNRLEV